MWSQQQQQQQQQQQHELHVAGRQQQARRGLRSNLGLVDVNEVLPEEDTAGPPVAEPALLCVF